MNRRGQSLFTGLLRAADVSGTCGVFGALWRIIPQLQKEERNETQRVGESG